MTSERPQHIGSFRILSLLGAGGMGEVYRAHDEKLGRDIALKVLPRELAQDPDRRARLLLEARAAASLNHPNICTIHEVGESDGAAYIAMEVVDGQPLSSRLAAGPLSPDEMLRYSLQLADALSHAHDRGVVHRDLKSANVMITPEGRLKVLDFGLAKRLKGDAAADLTTGLDFSLTVPGTIVGTLPYMAPEQFRGEAADARSDVWSLGVVLYEMAAGVRPFQGQTAFELSSAVLHKSPLPLPAGVPIPLEIVTSRCLEKDPSDRYQRGHDVRTALESMTASKRTLPASGDKAWFRRAILGVSSFAVLAIIAAVTWMIAPSSRRLFGFGNGRIESIAVLPLENLAGAASEDYFVTGIHEALITDLARIGLRKVIAKPSADAFKGTKKPLADIGRELGVDGLVTGTVLRARDRVQVTAQLVRASTGAVLWANRYERNAVDVLALQNELVGAIARELRATLTPEQTLRLADARRVNAAAHDAYLKARAMFAEFTTNFSDRTHFDGVLTQLERTIQLDPAYAPPYAALAVLYLAASQSSVLAPKDTFAKARAAALKAVELDDTLPDAHAALAEVYLWYDWNWAAADREIQRALQLNPESTDALRSSETYLTLVSNRFDEADRTSRRILDLDPLNPYARVQTVWVSFFSRRYDESIRRAQGLLEVSPNNLMGPFFLASNYATKKMAQEVRAECGKLMNVISAAYVMQVIGTCVWAQGTVGHAADAQRLLERLERPPAGIWLDPVVMAQAYAGLGDVNRAVEWSQKGLEDRAPNMIYLRADVHLDPLRSDPAFQAILRQMNFPP